MSWNILRVFSVPALGSSGAAIHARTRTQFYSASQFFPRPIVDRVHWRTERRLKVTGCATVIYSSFWGFALTFRNSVNEIDSSVREFYYGYNSRPSSDEENTAAVVEFIFELCQPGPLRTELHRRAATTRTDLVDVVVDGNGPIVKTNTPGSTRFLRWKGALRVLFCPTRISYHSQYGTVASGSVLRCWQLMLKPAHLWYLMRF